MALGEKSLTMFSLENVSLYYGKQLVQAGIVCEVKANEIVCLMGPSGCGKSTLLAALNGFLTEQGGHYEGNILYQGRDIRSYDPLLLRRQVAILFQDAKPFDLSIMQNLTYAMRFYEGRIRNPAQRVQNLLERVNLYEEVRDKLRSPAQRLSGGQQQRLCIARMLTTRPNVLLLDEPCASLDHQNTLIIEGLLRDLSQQHTIIITTHDVQQAHRLNARIVNLA